MVNEEKQSESKVEAGGEGKKLCDCGCGEVVNPKCRYINKHQNKSPADRRRISSKLKGKKRPKKEKVEKGGQEGETLRGEKKTPPTNDSGEHKPTS